MPSVTLDENSSFTSYSSKMIAATNFLRLSTVSFGASVLLTFYWFSLTESLGPYFT